MSLARRLVFSVLVTALVLGSLEGLSRTGPIRAWARRVIEERPLDSVDIHGRTPYLEPDDALFWRPRAGSRDIFGDRIGPTGWRGEAVRPLSEGGVRILVVGDSTAFGWGLPGERSFPSVMGQLLEARLGSDRVQVVNAAVPGYTSHQARIWLDRLLPEVAPRLVLVHVGTNDRAPAVFDDATRARMLAMEARLAGSALLTAMRALVRLAVPGARFDPTHPIGGAELPTVRVPDARIRENLAAMRRACRNAGARMLVLRGFSTNGRPPEPDAVWLPEGTYDVDLVPLGRQLFSGGWTSAGLFLADGFHFTTAGNELVGAWLAREVETRGALSPDGAR